MKNCEKAYDLAGYNNLRRERGYALIGMSFAYRAMSKLNKWLDYSYNALEIFQEINDHKGSEQTLYKKSFG